MNKLFEGKKLLVLGSTAHESPLIRRAQELGAYVITTDYYTDHRVSPAKDVADEYWDISWSDLDTLEQKCRKIGVNGVTAGFSEFRVDNMIKLCERLGLPHYITHEQLDITSDKAKFKKFCRKYDIPVTKEYESPESVSTFPVIVKPVDRGGSIGITIAKNREELDAAYKYAYDLSPSKNVIIEEYISDGREFTVLYAFSEGKIVYLDSHDSIKTADNGTERVVQSGWISPGHGELKFKKELDLKFREMLKGLGVKNGYIFISGFERPNGFVFFEAGFRLGGCHTWYYAKKKGITNVLDIMLCDALLGNTDIVEMSEDKLPNMKSIVINFYVRDGVIGKISGLEDLKKNDDFEMIATDAYEGQECHSGNAILTHICSVRFCNESPEKLAKDVDEAFSLVSVADDEGKDMLYGKYEGRMIGSWWT